MATKKTTKKAVKKKAVQKKKELPVEDKSTQFTLRLKAEVYNRLKSVAEQADVSMNQLVQGFCEAAVNTALVGEPIQAGKGNYKLRKTPGCICFGTFDDYRYQYNGELCTEFQLIEEMGADFINHPEVEEVGMDANIWFGLDFSGRAFRRY